MKKFRYIIAAVFIVAIGTVMFLSCEKDTKELNIGQNDIEKNQKNWEEEIFYFYPNDPGVYYWANNNGITFSLENDILLLDGDRRGLVMRDQGQVTSLICHGKGTSCGTAQEIDDNENIVREGLWVKEGDIYYVVLNPN